MAVKLYARNGHDIAEVYGDSPCISTTQDILDLMGSLGSSCPRLWIVREQALAPAFFDLSSGLAGGILQKLSNYGIRAAIVGDFGRRTSRSLQAFIRESNRGGDIFFVATLEEAEKGLLRAGKA